MSEDAVPRSARPEVRNSVLALDEMQEVLRLPAETRFAISELVHGINRRARQLSVLNLHRNKWWTAVYWRCISIYAKHIARAIRRGVADGSCGTSRLRLSTSRWPVSGVGRAGQALLPIPDRVACLPDVLSRHQGEPRLDLARHRAVYASTVQGRLGMPAGESVRPRRSAVGG